jgi:hypothetical protein
MHYMWIDPDHKRPFPDSAISIVNWLQSFKASGASPLTLRELSETTICPPPSEKPAQPVIASVHDFPTDAICEGTGGNK